MLNPGLAAAIQALTLGALTFNSISEFPIIDYYLPAAVQLLTTTKTYNKLSHVTLIHIATQA